MENKIDIRIVVMVGGWVLVGNYSQQKQSRKITQGYVIRQWGTGEGEERGLGTLAYMGPRDATQLDPIAVVEWGSDAQIMTFPCDPAKWVEILSKSPAPVGYGVGE